MPGPRIIPDPVPYAGEVRVVVLSIDGHPSFLVAKTNWGKPREKFIDEITAVLFGKQADGSSHDWDLVAAAKAAPVPHV